MNLFKTNNSRTLYINRITSIFSCVYPVETDVCFLCFSLYLIIHCRYYIPYLVYYPSFFFDVVFCFLFFGFVCKAYYRRWDYYLLCHWNYIRVLSLVSAFVCIYTYRRTFFFLVSPLSETNKKKVYMKKNH